MLQGTQSNRMTRRVLPGALMALALLVLLAGAAQAKTWHEWSPAPLASDSAFAALTLTPPGLMDEDERRWFEVQRAWRAQRDSEQRKWSRGLSESRPDHVEREGDERFAALASLPPAALADDDFDWLVAESAAQQRADQKAKSASAAVGAALLLGVVAGLAFALGVSYGITQGYAF